MKTPNNDNEETSAIVPMSPNEQRVKIEEFIEAFAQGMQAIDRAGKVIVELVDADPYVYDYIGQICPQMTPQLLRIIEDIGRGKVLPSLAFDTSEAARIMRRFPLPMQARLESESIPLVVRNQSGEMDVRLVKLSDMTKDQRAQAVDRDRLRTEGQQRAMLDEQSAKAAIIDIKAKATEMPWTIKGGFAIIGGVKLDRKQMTAILLQMS